MTPDGEEGFDRILGFGFGENRVDAQKNLIETARDNGDEELQAAIEDADPTWSEQLITDEQRDAIKLLVKSASGEAQPGGAEMEEAIEILREMSAGW